MPLPFRHQPSEALLLESLRSWRLARARQAGKQPSGVLPDQVLGAVAARSPLTYPDLLQVWGRAAGEGQRTAGEGSIGWFKTVDPVSKFDRKTVQVYFSQTSQFLA